MEAREIKLQDMIGRVIQYNVPLFQRPYSWDDSNKEWSTLWEDLSELCQEEGSTKILRGHFLGSVVTMPETSSPEGVAKFLLIDGQQRLTTIFITLIVLRDLAKERGSEKLANQIHEVLLVNEYEEDENHIKLVPTQGDRQAFNALLDGESSDPHSLIVKAYKFFKIKIERSGLDLGKIKQTITSRLFVVSIVLDHNDNPYLVFESLNAKGRPLTQADLIRNLFFMRIKANKQDIVYEQYWQPMQNKLEDNLTEYFRHFLLRGGSTLKKDEVYFGIKERLTKTADAHASAVEFLKELGAFANYYHALINPEVEENKLIKRGLSRLNRIEITVTYPFLLNCYDRYKNKKISTENFIQILELIENFMVRRFVCGIASGGLNGVFASLCQQIREETVNILEVTRKLLQTKNYPADEEFKGMLKESKLYVSGEKSVRAKFILECLEESYGNKEKVSFEKVSIEHVMPQKLTEEWKQYLGEDLEAAYSLLHTLGNLTLTGYNAELSNKSFNEKKKLLCEHSNFELNKYFRDKSDWRREEIEKRAEHLAQIALQVWPYFGSNDKHDNQDDVTNTKPKCLKILDQRFEVKAWQDVLVKTLNVVIELSLEEDIEKLLHEFPTRITKNSKLFKVSKSLKNGLWVVGNLSAMDIKKFCQRVLNEVEIDLENWKVEIE
jgi:uncharacterized protein with ParB-like and HNH nuclease domain